MPIIVVGGAQWGDEGKGKVTDYLASEADVVVRYQGGNNAGHTIVFGGKKYPLSLLPSGIFQANKLNVLANGMVINPDKLLEEIAFYQGEGFKFNLKISNRAQLIMPYHLDLDGAAESLKSNKIGTTKKGIGPAYSDKINRIAIRMGDLLNLKSLKRILHETLIIKNLELKMYGLKEYDEEELYSRLVNYSNQLSSYICDTSLVLNEAIKENKYILFEGAQGAMLCIDHGTFPYVTSSSPLASSVPLNVGIAPRYVDNVLGIVKAYATRVGEGNFPTELNNELGDLLRERGHEYGTVTHRPRRCGWIDLVAIRHAIRVSGINQIALMLLDVLSGFEEIKMGVSYNFKGEVIDYVPSNIDDFALVTPNYESVPGWSEDITNCHSFENLPKNAQNYINKLEELLGVPVSIVSVGPDRNQTIIRRKIW